MDFNYDALSRVSSSSNSGNFSEFLYLNDDIYPNQSVSEVNSKFFKKTLWDFFKKSVDGNFVVCQVKNCRKPTLKFNPSTRTNMSNHLRLHPAEYKLFCGTELKKKVESERMYNFLNKNIFTEKSFGEALIRLVVKQNLSFSLVESIEFVDLVSLLRPETKIFKSDKVKYLIMDKYKCVKEERVNFYKNLGVKISFTTDIWTSPNQIPFLSITSHFIDDKFMLKSDVLDMVYFNDLHSGKHIYKAFAKVIQFYDISGLCFGITMDNAQNNNTFMDELIMSDFPFDSNCHFNCFAHVLNLAVKAFLKLEEESISNLRNMVRKIRLSPKKLDRLRELCNNFKIKFVKPILDVPIRWNSTFDMLERAILLKNPIQIMLSEMNSERKNMKQKFEIQDSSWEQFKKIFAFLKLFKDATELMSGDTYPKI